MAIFGRSLQEKEIWVSTFSLLREIRQSTVLPNRKATPTIEMISFPLPRLPQQLVLSPAFSSWA